MKGTLDSTDRGFSPLMLSIENYFNEELGASCNLVPVQGSAVLAESGSAFAKVPSDYDSYRFPAKAPGGFPNRCWLEDSVGGRCWVDLRI